MLTRRDFEAVAHEVRVGLEPLHLLPLTERKVIMTVAKGLKQTNYLFDTERFIAAATPRREVRHANARSDAA